LLPQQPAIRPPADPAHPARRSPDAGCTGMNRQTCGRAQLLAESRISRAT
jgi:hypothetical protein